MADAKITELGELAAAPAAGDVVAIVDLDAAPATTKKITATNLVDNNAAVAASTTHRTSDGSDHSDVVANSSHAIGDGSDHADVATATVHVNGDGSDHADVATATTHISSSGADHSDVVANTAHTGATGNPHTVTFTQAVTADGATDITAAEAETLTDNSIADNLHTHWFEIRTHFKDRLKFKTAAYVEASTTMFPGTDNLPTIVNSKAVIVVSVELGTNVGQVRLVDKDNSDAVIFEITGITTTARTIFTDATLTNLPATRSLFGIQGLNDDADDTELVEMVLEFNT